MPIYCSSGLTAYGSSSLEYLGMEGTVQLPSSGKLNLNGGTTYRIEGGHAYLDVVDGPSNDVLEVGYQQATSVHIGGTGSHKDLYCAQLSGSILASARIDLPTGGRINLSGGGDSANYKIDGTFAYFDVVDGPSNDVLEVGYQQATSVHIGGTGSHKDLYCATLIEDSDERRKENIEDLQMGVDFLKLLRPRSFEWKDYPALFYDDWDDENFKIPVGKSIGDQKVPAQSGSQGTHFGLIAQEVDQVLSGSGINANEFAPLKKKALKDRDGNYIGDYSWGMQYSEYIAILIKAVQELSAKVEALENE